MKHYFEVLLNLPVHLLSDSYEYIEKSDSAHNEEHIRAVVMMADKLTLDDTLRKTTITAALTHDLGCSIRGGRDKHEVYSAHIVKGLLSDYPGEFDEVSIIKATLEHRASFNGTRELLTSRIVAAADRGKPNSTILFWRAYVYAKEVGDVCHEVAINHSIEYNKSKYGYEGYSRMRDDTLLFHYYPKECEDIESVFDNATFSQVETQLETLRKSI